MLQPGHVGEGSVAANGFQQSIFARKTVFRVQHRVDQGGIYFSVSQQTFAQGAQRFLFRQSDQIVRELRNPADIQRDRQPLIVAHLRDHLVHAGQKFVRIGQSQIKGDGFTFQFGWQFDGRSRNDQRSPFGAERVRQIAKPARDVIVVAITRYVAQQKNSFAVNQRNVRERLLELVGAVDGRAFPLGQAGGNGPGEKRNAKVGRERLQQSFKTIFLGGFDRDDRIAGIDQQP